MSSRLLRSVAAALFVAVSVASFVRGNTLLGVVFLVAAVIFIAALAKGRQSDRTSR
ncbi:hypothetical protein CHEID_01635 [Corynebacterium heidelbergense]|nr:hypothetical protein CHEID_01635 [Corynebacterium heidelbergense]